MAQLSAEERAQHARFVQAHDRRDYAAAHALLRSALSFYDPRPPASWTFVAGEWGKPRLASPERLTFNLSHTRGLVACAIGHGADNGPDIGIDVESVNEAIDIEAIAQHNFSPREVAQLMALPAHQRAERFIDFWTLKEAYVKATGNGITQGLNHWGFELRGDEEIVFVPPADAVNEDWTFALYAPSGSARMAVAVRANAGEAIHLIARKIETLEFEGDALGAIRRTKSPGGPDLQVGAGRPV